MLEMYPSEGFFKRPKGTIKQKNPGSIRGFYGLYFFNKRNTNDTIKIKIIAPTSAGNIAKPPSSGQCHLR